MKIKQTIVAFIFIVFSLGVIFPFITPDTVQAQANSTEPGKCPGNISDEDEISANTPCAIANRNAAGISAVEARRIVDECNARDRDEATLGSCYNALGSCKKYVVDASYCTNPGLLEHAARTCIGNGSSTKQCSEEEYLNAWDKAVDYHNNEYGGDDLQTNSALRRARDDEFAKQRARICQDLYSNDVNGYDTCMERMQNAFDACYDNVGGSKNGTQTKIVDQAALDNCIKNDKNYREYTAGPQCKAEGKSWVQYADGGRCEHNAQSCGKSGGNWVKTGQNVGGQGIYECQGGSNPEVTATDPVTTPGAANNTTAEGGTCGGARTVLIPSDELPGCKEEGVSAIGAVMKLAIMILSVGIGIVAVGGVVYGALLYASAQDNSGQTQKAIVIIRTVLIGVLLYIFMISLLNWLVPGGVIG